MAIITTNDQHYKNIAKAIRTNAGTETEYTPQQMPDGIAQVHSAGYDQGYETGYGVGYESGFSYGEESYRNIFWDSYQQSGTRTNYNLAFAGTGWTQELFWPLYDMTVTSGYQMFAYMPFQGSLKKRLEACKVKLQFSGNQSLMNLFGFASKITELGVIDFGAVTGNNNNTHIFNQCASLHTIEKLVVPVGQPTWSSWFSGCVALENIRFAGAIIHSGLNMSDCVKLTRESIISLFSALADVTSASGVHKVTLGSTNLAKLSDADKAMATEKGWTLA